MSIVVYLGPTLPRQQAKAELDCEYKPPAKRGDFLRAISDGAKIIGLIDGYFRFYPAVQHKEILWAMCQGCHVYGAASMGALRAAELHKFGMIGVGRIFRDFLEGRLECDDEVAVEHGPAEMDFLPISDAMVNIRYTLASAETAGLLTKRVARCLLNIASGVFYPHRTFKTVLDDYMLRFEVTAPLAETLFKVAANQIDQKALDARELLRTIKRDQAQQSVLNVPNFKFEDTLYFSELRSILNNPILSGPKTLSRGCRE